MKEAAAADRVTWHSWKSEPVVSDRGTSHFWKVEPAVSDRGTSHFWKSEPAVSACATLAVSRCPAPDDHLQRIPLTRKRRKPRRRLPSPVRLHEAPLRGGFILHPFSPSRRYCSEMARSDQRACNSLAGGTFGLSPSDSPPQPLKCPLWAVEAAMTAVRGHRRSRAAIQSPPDRPAPRKRPRRAKPPASITPRRNWSMQSSAAPWAGRQGKAAVRSACSIRPAAAARSSSGHTTSSCGAPGGD